MSAMMLSIVPSFEFAEQKTELIFVVDRSGSMQGQGIQLAKQGLMVSNYFSKNCKFYHVINSMIYFSCSSILFQLTVTLTL